MRNGNIRMSAATTPTSQPGQLITAEPGHGPFPGGSHAEPALVPRQEFCGAMALQRGGGDHWSAPQGLVHLVGCRAPRISAEAVAGQPYAMRQQQKS